jgi:DinB superfamily
MTQTELQNLIAFLAATPEVVRQLTGMLGGAAVGWKPPSGEFSALENACHLRDIEQEGYTVRLRRLLTEDEPALADIDGARLARERDYQSQDCGAALDAFAAARRANVATIAGLSPEQLQRAGTFAGERITLARLLEMMRAHDEAHRAELRALARSTGGAQT